MRYTTPNSTLPTRYTYTGQYSYINDEATDIGNDGFGLMFYNARWYDPALGRFAQADTIIPQSQGVQAWDRYAYVSNNPVRYDDPTGHCGPCGSEINFGYTLVAMIFPNASIATTQAVGLVVSWFFETDEQIQVFGPDAPITKEVMEQNGYDKFYEEWEAADFEDGFLIPTTIEDDRSNPLEWASLLVDSHMIELPLALSGSEDHSAIPGTIGSLDYISATYTEDGQVMIEVFNTMGRASGTRVMNGTWLDNKPRSETWWGGTTKQTFYWFIDLPNSKKDKQE